MENPLTQRKHPRLKSDVYDRDGMYFITICTRNRSACLSRIETQAGKSVVVLSEIGKTVEMHLRKIGMVNTDVYADTYMIMPDHVHLLLRVCGYVSTKEEGWSPAVHTRIVRVIRSFKTAVTKELGFSIWQTSFYDRIVRDKNEYMACRRYILENPARWLAKYGKIP